MENVKGKVIFLVSKKLLDNDGKSPYNTSEIFPFKRIRRGQ